MRSNLIGHTVFPTSEKFCMTNQKPDTIFFTSEKICIGFSRLSGQSCEVIESEMMLTTFPALPESCLQGLQTLIQWNIYRGPRKRKYKKENSTECCFTQGISDAEEVVKTYRRNSPEGAECIHR